MSLDTRAVAPPHDGDGSRWWPGHVLARSRLTVLGPWMSPPCRHQQGRRPWSSFIWHWTALVVLLVPALGMMRLLGTIERHGAVAAVAAVTLVSLLRTLLEAAPARPLSAPLPPGEAGTVERPAAAESAGAPAMAEARLATCKEFDDAVRRALTHLCDPTRLATSPLLHLILVTAGLQARGLQDTRLNRGIALKSVLTDLLEGLRSPRQAGSCVGEARRYYNCLYFPYVQGVSRRRGPTVLRQLQERRRSEGGAPTDAERVIAWLLQVDENTYYKWQRRGSDTIAAVLREQERAAGGVVPAETLQRAATNASAGTPHPAGWALPERAELMA